MIDPKFDFRCAYTSTVGDFIADVENGDFIKKMEEGAKRSFLYAGDSERMSWQKNGRALQTLLQRKELYDARIAFEVRSPSSGRIDCMLFGRGEDEKNISSISN